MDAGTKLTVSPGSEKKALNKKSGTTSKQIVQPGKPLLSATGSSRTMKFNPLIGAILLFILCSSTGTAQAQQHTDPFLKELLDQKASPLLKNILSKPDSFHYQLIYTKIDRDKNNKPHFTHYYYRLDPDDYFNPASMVKLPVAVIALEKMRGLRKKGVDKFSPMLTDSAYSRQTRVLKDSTSENGYPSVAHYVNKIFYVSDNDAYNRLYEFNGQQYMNERLWKMGYKDMRITRRFVTMNEDENRHTNPIRFLKNDDTIYTQAPAFNTIPFNFSKKILIGKAHLDRQDKLINEPMDFTTHNNAPLNDLQQILQSVLFPSSVPKNKRFRLKKEDYRFLYTAMSTLPTETRYPRYDTSEFFSSYTKFFMFKSGRTIIPSNIRVFNKTGWSYGFLTDVAYIVDFEKNIEFMLSGTIYVNADGVLNDNKYEYEQTGYPFFKEVGNIIYEYEQERERPFKPDLQKFRSLR
jgi:hypothetical protein